MPCMIAVVKTLKTTTHVKNLWWVFNTLAKFRLDMMTLTIYKNMQNTFICVKKEKLYARNTVGTSGVLTVQIRPVGWID